MSWRLGLGQAVPETMERVFHRFSCPTFGLRCLRHGGFRASLVFKNDLSEDRLLGECGLMDLSSSASTSLTIFEHTLHACLLFAVRLGWFALYL